MTRIIIRIPMYVPDWAIELNRKRLLKKGILIMCPWCRSVVPNGNYCERRGKRLREQLLSYNECNNINKRINKEA